MFQPGMCTKVWLCDECSFILCKPCTVFYAADWVKSPTKKLNQRRYEKEEENYDMGEEDF